MKRRTTRATFDYQGFFMVTANCESLLWLYGADSSIRPCVLIGEAIPFKENVYVHIKDIQKRIKRFSHVLMLFFSIVTDY